MTTIDSAPWKDGIRIPGELEAHADCWILRPERPDTVPLRAKPAQRASAEAAEVVANLQPVTMGLSGDPFLNARWILPNGICVTDMFYNDSWTRDCGSTFVVSDKGAVHGVDSDFNACGGLAPPQRRGSPTNSGYASL